MNEFQSIGKLLILIGSLIVAVGLLITFWDKIPLLGKLSGDIMLKGKNFTFYFPIVTPILLSIIISIVIHFLRK